MYLSDYALDLLKKRNFAVLKKLELSELLNPFSFERLLRYLIEPGSEPGTAIEDPVVVLALDLEDKPIPSKGEIISRQSIVEGSLNGVVVELPILAAAFREAVRPVSGLAVADSATGGVAYESPPSPPCLKTSLRILVPGAEDPSAEFQVLISKNTIRIEVTGSKLDWLEQFLQDYFKGVDNRIDPDRVKAYKVNLWGCAWYLMPRKCRLDFTFPSKDEGGLGSEEVGSLFWVFGGLPIPPAPYKLMAAAKEFCLEELPPRSYVTFIPPISYPPKTVLALMGNFLWATEKCNRGLGRNDGFSVAETPPTASSDCGIGTFFRKRSSVTFPRVEAEARAGAGAGAGAVTPMGLKCDT